MASKKKRKILEVRVYGAEFITTDATEHSIELISDDVNGAVETVDHYIDEYLDHELVDLKRVERVGTVFIDHTQWKNMDDDDDDDDD